MSQATIKIRDLANGQIAIKLVLDPNNAAASPAHKAAQDFLAWLGKSQKTKQSQPAAQQQQ